MGGRQVDLLVRADEEASPDHADAEAERPLLVGVQHAFVVGDVVRLREQHLQHRPVAADQQRDGELAPHRLDLRADAVGHRVEALVGAGLGQHVQRRQAGGGRDRVAVEGPGHEGALRVVERSPRIHGLQHVGAAADRGVGVAAGDRLAVGGKIRHHAVPLLRAAPGDAEAGHHLIEDQDDAVLGGELAQGLQEGWLGTDAALQRLHADRRQLAGVPLDELARHGRVVERRKQQIVGHRCRQAGGVGGGVRVVAGLERLGSVQREVADAVPAALEAQHAPPPREGARHAHGEGDRVGAGGHEADLLPARRGVEDALAQLDDLLVEAEVGRAELQLLGDRRHHRGMAVAEDHRPAAVQEVDVLAPVGVVELAALSAHEHHGDVVRQVKLAHRAADEDASGTLQQVRLSHAGTVAWPAGPGDAHRARFSLAFSCAQ